MQTYFLDIATLLTILSRQKRSGILQAASVHIPNVRGSVSVSLVIEHGVAQTCQLMQKQKVILDGEQAYQAILALSVIEWEWQPLPTPQRPLSPVQRSPSPPADARSRKNADFPQQTVSARDRTILQQLSRQHRKVSSLCDGTRSLNKIATMLLVSPQDLIPYIRDLENWRLVQFRSPRASE